MHVVDATHELPTDDGTSRPIELGFDGISAAAAAAGFLFAPFSEAPQSTTLFCHSALIIALIAMRRLVGALLPPRPVHAATMLLAFAQIQPLALVVACLLEGDVVYATGLGAFSHHDQTVRVAVATLVLCAATSVAALLVALLDRRPAPPWSSFLARINDSDMRILQLIGTALFVAQLVLLFDRDATVINRDLGGLYVVQVAVGALHGASLYVGVALRRRHATARAVLPFLVAGAVIMVIGGNRFPVVLLVIELAAGYVLAGVVSRAKLVSLAALAAAVSVLTLVAGDVLRGDGGGRSGQVAVQRLTDIVAGDSHAELDSETVRLTTVHRILRNSTHTTISRVPETIPFDPAGVEGMPKEFANTFLPGTLRGDDWHPELRAMFLRELGYIINDTTAVEFALLGDAWYRGGWLALIVVGLVLGIALQIAESYAYLGSPLEQALKVVTVVTAVHHMEGRDIVFGVRRLLLMCVTASALLFLLRLRARGAFSRQAVQPTGPIRADSPARNS